MGGVDAPEERCCLKPLLDGRDVLRIPAVTVEDDFELDEVDDFLGGATTGGDREQGLGERGQGGFAGAFEGDIGHVDTRFTSVTEDTLEERRIGFRIRGENQDISRVKVFVGLHGLDELIPKYFDFTDHAVAAVDGDRGALRIFGSIETGPFSIEMLDALLE